MFRRLLILLSLGFLATSPRRAAESPSRAVFADGAINAYVTSTWVAREQGFFRKHNVEVSRFSSSPPARRRRCLPSGCR